jgi:DNA polymerase-3 subunit epsilon
MKSIDPCGCFPTGRHYPGIANVLKVRAIGIADEFDADSVWRAQPIAFLDTETTGLDSKTERIIEVGIVIGKEGAVIARHNWLINPGIPIPAASSDVHGIKDEDVADKPSFADVAPEIMDALGGSIPAAYNASFDRGFILSELERAAYEPSDPPAAVRRGVVWIDPLVFARELYKGKGESRALGAVAERLGVTMGQAHRATDDAEAGLMVLYKMAEDSRIPQGYAAFVQEQRRLEQQQEEARRFWR